ncbi:MAG: translocation/assembly module TamB domain-containing protein, partial [Myxococcales bacterium]|nr:translocation/assembly module TamB domain-containing protein [Myxococcales bacterium]
LSLRAQGLTPERLRPFWRAHPAADFTVDLQVDAEGPLGALAGDGRLTGTLADGDHAPLPLAAALKVRPEAQRLEASVGRAVILELGTELPLLAWREGRFHPGQAAVAGALGLAVPLSTAAPYLPGDLHDPQGQLDGRFTVAGSLARPAFAGQATLEGGAVTVIAGHQRLRALTVRLTAADTRLTIERLAAASGVGTWAGSGHLELAASPEGDPTAVPLWSAWALTTALDLTARRVPFLHPLVSAGLADGHVAVHSVQRPGDTQATVTVDGARVDLTAIRMPPAQAIPHNGRIQVVDWAGRARGPERLFVGDDHLALTVALAEPVTVEGDGVRLRIGGTLALDRTAERAEVTGGFDVLEGEFSLFENPFTLRRGRISLQGGPLVTVEGDLTAETARLRDPDAPPKAAALEPIFDWLAEGEVVGTYVDLAIRGPARRPELILASDPPLPEYRILTLLVTGRVDAVDGRNGDVRRQVAKLVDRFHNPSLSRQLYDRLGVDKLGLKFQSLSQPVLTVGKQVNRQLYVETVYHHNAPPDENEKEARVEYRLDPSWTLDTAYGDAAVGSVGVFWKRDFGGPAPQRKATRPLAEAPDRAAED